MPNAKEVTGLDRGYKILVLGNAGSGKTTQFGTLPGRKFAYLFDPNAILSLRGMDVDYEEWLPDRVPMKVVPLDRQSRSRAKSAPSQTLYAEWERDVEKKLREGFFDQYDWIMFDSLTTFADMVMDQVLAMQGKAGQWPERDDWAPQMMAIKSVVREFAALGKNIYFTGHVEVRQDELTGRLLQTPVMTGRLKVMLPMLFSELLYAEARTDPKSGEVSFVLQTKPDRMNPLIRTSIKGLPAFVDVTIDWNKPVEGQGLGGILLAAQKGGRGVAGDVPNVARSN